MYFDRNGAAECVGQQVKDYYHQIVDAIMRWRENRIRTEGYQPPITVEVPIWIRFEDPGSPLDEPESNHLVNKRRHGDGTICLNLWCRRCAAKAAENQTEAQADLSAAKNWRLRQLGGDLRVCDFRRHEDDNSLCLEPHKCQRCTVELDAADELNEFPGDCDESEDSL